MPVFQFTAIDERGRGYQGREEAISQAAIEGRIRRLGHWVAELREIKPVLHPRSSAMFGGSRVPAWVLGEFFMQLHIQLKAGIPLLTALGNESSEGVNPAFRRVLFDVTERVQAGQSLSDGLASHPRVFSKLLVSLVRVGEASGKLAESCQQARAHLDWQERLKSDVRQALIYPAFVLTSAALFVVLVFSFVIPRFKALLTELKVPLPEITQVVLGVSDFCIANWSGLAIGAALSVVFWKLASQVPSTAIHLDRLKMSIPVFGKLYHMVGLARFSRNLGAIYSAGVPLMEALNLVGELVGNRVLEAAVHELRGAVGEGRQMHVVMGKNPAFSRLVVQMVTVGETTGSLGPALDNVASYYDEVLPRQVKRMFSILEPMMILGLVGFIGVIALSVFLPIVSLMNIQ